MIPAAGAGKLKTTIQNVFIGAVILWFAFRDAMDRIGLESPKSKIAHSMDDALAALDTGVVPRYVQRMSIQLQHDKLNEGILAGKLMEVFDAYYAATVTMQENDAPACVG